MGIYVTWLITHASDALFVGLFLALGGAVSVVVGIVLLAIVSVLHMPEPTRPQHWRAIGYRAAFLATCVVAGIAIILCVLDLSTRYRVSVHNRSGKTLHVRIEGGGIAADPVMLEPDAVTHRSMWFEGEGPLELEAKGPGLTIDEVIDGYVYRGKSEDRTITIHADGKLDVSSK
ncbi:MAG: hypothetical protein KDC95_15200 [Planctomycetes bacterium]|nr:hypothetical protein [Planctomycetota bacterium]